MNVEHRERKTERDDEIEKSNGQRPEIEQREAGPSGSYKPNFKKKLDTNNGTDTFPQHMGSQTTDQPERWSLDQSATSYTS
jgi:hypothetical protein